MTKRDHELIARVIRETPNVPRAKLAKAFADELQQISPAFKRAVFIRACGVKLIMSHEATIKVR